MENYRKRQKKEILKTTLDKLNPKKENSKLFSRDKEETVESGTYTNSANPGVKRNVTSLSPRLKISNK